jgi:RimJ/RimL family protein N-acetyltransferase
MPRRRILARMTILEPVTLTGRHVRLVPLRPEHAPALHAAADESRRTYALTFMPRDFAEMEAYVAEALAEQDRGESLPFAVCDAAGVPVGSTRFLSIERWAWPGPPPEPVPVGPDVVEIGCTWYAERVQRTAVNTEAKLLLCTHAFEQWRVRRVRWKTDARNARSRAAILRLGARFDGVLRAHWMAADGTVRDSAFFSMLASEWPEAKQALYRRLERGATLRAEEQT